MQETAQRRARARAAGMHIGVQTCALRHWCMAQNHTVIISTRSTNVDSRLRVCSVGATAGGKTSLCLDTFSTPEQPSVTSDGYYQVLCSRARMRLRAHA